jgi:hypothetical protein
MSPRIRSLAAASMLVMFAGAGIYAATQWAPLPVKDDPLVRMPGTQPEQQVILEGPNRCMNCHAGYNESVEPGFNWKGSMMAQAARDPIFWACVTVAAQDSIWALGNPNATDLCLRCHFPEGWLAGRSDPTNAEAMIGSDYDGLHCDFCHRMWDPYAKDTHAGERETDDWSGYWDEHNNTGPGSNTLSQTEADKTYDEDLVEQAGVKLFRGADFFVDDMPRYSTYSANVSGQFFVAGNAAKRASFADAAARHQMLYSRHHKSRDFCATCHDVSNPALANLTVPLPDQSDGADLISEQYSASHYFHVERTLSEFMLSAYGELGGAPTNADFQAQGAPEIVHVTKCQDCHMRNVRGVGADKNGVPIRPDGSTEHPYSGQPLHDLTGGNTWISYILATLDDGGPVYDAVNADLLMQGPDVLTLDFSMGESPADGNGAALLAGSERAKQQLRLAGTIKNLAYDPVSGEVSFRVQNNTAHKLISGFPEGRRMFVNIQAYLQGQLIAEVNPYSNEVGTLKGLPNSPNSPSLEDSETYADELVYEVHPKSDLTGENETFHFVLATGRYKDNRIPPKGFDLAGSFARLCEPVWHGVSAPAYFTEEEYDGGYDDVTLTIVPGADQVVVVLYYQGTSREYVEFLRDEINGTARTLPADDPAAPYVIQTDPFFAKLKAWGDTIWDLWWHNHGLDDSGVSVEGIVPFEMARAELAVTPPPCDPPVPALSSAVPGNTEITLTWSNEHDTDPGVVGYNVYYDQSGRSQLVAELGLVATYIDTDLTNGQEYSYKVTSRYATCESTFSNTLRAVPNNQGQARVEVNSLTTGRYETNGGATTFVARNTFTAGNEVVIRISVIDDSTDLPVSGATVEVRIAGPETVGLSAISDAGGLAEVKWSTSAPYLPGDANGDGAVTDADYTIWADNYGASPASPEMGDFNGDGVVSDADYTVWADNYGADGGGTSPGSYTVSVTNLDAEGYTWDDTAPTAGFTLE